MTPMSPEQDTTPTYAAWPDGLARRRLTAPDRALIVVAAVFTAWAGFAAATALFGPPSWTWTDDAGRVCTAVVTPTGAAVDCVTPGPSLKDLFSPDAFDGAGTIADTWK